MIRFIVIFLFFITNAFAAQITFNEVNSFFGTSSKSSVNIIPLWQKLEIVNPRPFKQAALYIFNCKPEQLKCNLTHVKTKIIEHGEIKIIQISNSDSNYQYLFFKRAGNAYIYFDHLEGVNSEINVLDNDLFAIKTKTSSGKGFVVYKTNLFQITDGKLKMLLSFPSKDFGFGWDIFDRTIVATQNYEKGVLTINFEIKIFMPQDHKNPRVQAKKIVVLVGKPEGFVLDKQKSDTTLAIMNYLPVANSAYYYLLFKEQFDVLEKSDPKTQEWYMSIKSDAEKQKDKIEKQLSKLTEGVVE